MNEYDRLPEDGTRAGTGCLVCLASACLVVGALVGLAVFLLERGAGPW